ncbi:MAG: hypothetical protein MUF16_01485, partial [Burkholderiaceae bacterium]|nr:hypothetical protein [Burkholderiaceae bacterium]
WGVGCTSWASILCSQIYTGTTEANLTIAGNTFVNTGVATCLYEVSEGTSAAASGVSMVNNSFSGATTAALKVRDVITRTNNAFWNCPVNVQTNTSAVALSNGAGVVTADPLLSPSYRPLPSSPIIGAGTHLGYTRDLGGVQRRNPPSIGAFDVATLVQVE